MRMREFAVRILIFLITAWVVCFKASTPGIKAQGEVLLSADAAFTFADKQVSRAQVNIPEWQGSRLSSPEVHYNLDGQPAAYVFSVLKNGEDVGYITVSARRIANPVLEFSTAPARHKVSQAEVRAAAESLGTTVDEGRPLYLGMLAYYYRLESEGQTWLVEMGEGNVVTLDEALIPEHQQGQDQLPGASDAEAVFPLSLAGTRQGTTVLKLLFGPDYGWYLGCGPTAVANVMGHWADRGYPNLVYGGSGGDYPGTIQQLAALMGTSPEGWTFLPIDDDISAFAAQRGYTFYSREIEDPSYADFVAEIDAHRPIVILVNDHYVYSDHFITGFGYEYDPADPSYRYMIVHDTWGSSNEFHWVQYGVGYGNIWFDTVIPPTIWLDKTPPISQVDSLPSYQTSEVFKVRWSGSDQGWGLMWYDVQYREGLSGIWTDWITRTASTQADFAGERGGTYYFRSRAADIDNNQELYPEGDGDTHTVVAQYVVSGYVRGNRDLPVMDASVTASTKSLGSARTDGLGYYRVPMSGSAVASFRAGGSADFGSLPPMEEVMVSGDVEGLDFILPPAQELLLNGGFESGLVGWSMSGDLTPTITTTAHTGAGAVLLGPVPPAVGISSILSQTVLIPAGVDQPTLSFMAKPLSLESTSDQFILVLSSPTATLTHTISLASAGWQHIWFDLGEYAGQSVQVRFQSRPDPLGDPMTVFVDEISLGPASQGATWIYLPAVLKTHGVD